MVLVQLRCFHLVRVVGHHPIPYLRLVR
jgi:hypothetical protein